MGRKENVKLLSHVFPVPIVSRVRAILMFNSLPVNVELTVEETTFHQEQECEQVYASNKKKKKNEKDEDA